MTRRHGLLAAVLAGAVACGADPATDWSPVKRGDLVIGAELTGALAAVDSTPIKPPPIRNRWDFKIAQLAEEGAEVSEGEVVVAFDPSEMMQELERLANDADAVAVEFDRRKNDAAMARKDEALRIAEAEAQLRKATLKADQSDELAASLEIATAEIDRSVAEIDLGHARSAAERAKRHDAAAIRSLEEKLAYYRGRVRELEDSIGRMMVKAPRAGTVIFPTGWSGDKKKVGDAAWRMETVLEIVSLDKMIGEGDVDEVDSSVVAVGQRVTLRLDAHADSELVGRVAEIANTVQRKSQADPSKVVRLEIELSETGDLPLRPGMRFRGLVETERAEGVLLMPAEAVFITPSGPIAYRRSNGGHEVVEIEIGRRNSRQVEVRKGLADGDQVSRVDIDREAI